MRITANKVLVCLLATLGSTGCGAPSDRVSEVRTLRLLAVRSESPFAKPGSVTQLSMLAFDGSPRAVRADGSRRATSTLWIGGCTNPPGDSYAACTPYLHEVLRQLGPDNLAAGVVPDDAPSGILGWGPSFEAHVPTDVVTSRPVAHGVVNPYGVQIVFVAHCGGVLRRVTEDVKQFPLGCFDADTGEPLGRDDFDFGFYPLFSYDSVENHNPLIDALDLSGTVEGSDCSDASPCGDGYHCGSQGQCLPIISRCTASDADDCEKHVLSPQVPESSVEPAVVAHVSSAEARSETIWVSYYATGGSFEHDAQLVNEPNTGWNSNSAGVWRANSAPNREVRLWAIVRDNRNGVAWSWRDVWVQ